MHDLVILTALLGDGLPVGPAHRGPGGRYSRGWLLRLDRGHPRTVRLDWVHGPTDADWRPTAEEKDALRRDVLAAAARLVSAAGYRAKPAGTGLLLTPAWRHSPA